jgi:hypothetical protein
MVVTKAHCQSKEGAIKSYYKDHLFLEKKSGFTWNENTGTFDAPDEAWEELIAVSLYQFNIG